MEDTLPAAMKIMANKMKLSFIEGLGEPIRAIIVDMKNFMEETDKAREKLETLKKWGYEVPTRPSLPTVTMTGLQTFWKQILPERLENIFLPVLKMMEMSFEQVADYTRIEKTGLLAWRPELEKIEKQFGSVENAAKGIIKITADKTLEDWVKKQIKAGVEWEAILKEPGKYLNEINKTMVKMGAEPIAVWNKEDTESFKLFYAMWYTFSKEAEMSAKETIKANRLVMRSYDRTLDKMEKAHKYRLMELSGATKSTILTKEIADWHKTINRELSYRIEDAKRGLEIDTEKIEKVQLLQNLLKDEELTRDNILKNYEMFAKAFKDVLGSTKELDKLLKALEGKIYALEEETRRLANTFETGISGSLFNIIKGTGTWEDMLWRINDIVLQEILKSLVRASMIGTTLGGWLAPVTTRIEGKQKGGLIRGFQSE